MHLEPETVGAQETERQVAVREHAAGDLGDLSEHRLHVEGARQASAPAPLDLLAVTGPQDAAYHGSLDPHAPALFNVAWAGEQTSPNWFDIGREYTERWHHQQQIREAVGAPG